MYLNVLYRMHDVARLKQRAKGKEMCLVRNMRRLLGTLQVSIQFHNLIAMASNLVQPNSHGLQSIAMAVASNLIAVASNPIAMASNLL